MNCPEVVFCFESEEKRISGFGRPLPAEGREDLEGEGGEEECEIPPWSCEPSMGLTAHAGSRRMPVLALMERFLLFTEEVG